LEAALAGLVAVLEAGRAASAGAGAAVASLKAGCFAVEAAGEEAGDAWAVRP